MSFSNKSGHVLLCRPERHQLTAAHLHFGQTANGKQLTWIKHVKTYLHVFILGVYFTLSPLKSLKAH